MGALLLKLRTAPYQSGFRRQKLRGRLLPRAPAAARQPMPPDESLAGQTSHRPRNRKNRTCAGEPRPEQRGMSCVCNPRRPQIPRGPKIVRSI